MYGHAEVVARLVLVGDLQGDFYRGLLLVLAVSPQLECGIRVQPLGPRVPGRRRRRKMALTCATPSSSLNTMGTRMMSSIE